MPNTREKLLAATSRVVKQRGAARLTLELVAAEAKVSKGGLLYHFPTKQALIGGLVKDLIVRFDSACDSLRTDDKAGSFTHAYLQATLVDDISLSSGIASAVANDPALLKPLRRAYVRWQAQLEDDGIDRVEATIVRLVADGLWFTSLIDLPAPKPGLLKAVIERLRSRTNPKRMTHLGRRGPAGKPSPRS